MSRWAWLSGLVVLVAGAVVYFTTPSGVPVRVATASTGEIRTYVEERAKTRLPQIDSVTMPLDGRVLPITVKAGDHVKAGQQIARMDPVDLDTELSAAKAQVGQFLQLLLSMNETIKAAAQQLVASQAKLNFAKEELDRRTGLFERNAVSESSKNEAELLEIESRVEHQQNALIVRAVEALRNAIELGQQDAEETRRRRERDRRRAEIESPVDGVVLSRLVSSERVLAAGEVLLEIGRMEDLEIEAEILTQDAVQIRVGDPVDVEGPAIGREPLPAAVTRIYPQGFTKVSSLGVEQQRVLVIIQPDPEKLAELQAAGRQLGVDYRVRVKIYTDGKSNVLKIPRSAVFRGGNGGWRAFVVRDNRAQLADLEVGLMNDFEVEVISGILSGEPVIIAPESSLGDGQLVQMVPETE